LITSFWSARQLKPNRGRSLWIAALALLLVQLAGAQQVPTEKDRLIATGRLWVTVKYFHPYLAYRNIDWDQALIHALPTIRSAQNKDEYARAEQTLLDALDDPATYVVSRSVAASSTGLKFETRSGALIVSEGGTSASSDLQTAIESATNVVFDLRSPNPYLSELLDEPAFQQKLTSAPLETPGQRTWIHNGLPPEAADENSRYYSAFHVKPGARISAGDAGHSRHYVFLLGEQSRLPVIATALASAGHATILTEAPHYAIAGTETALVDLGAGLEASLRLSEPVFAKGTGLPDAATVPHENALNEAMAQLQKPAAAQAVQLPPYPSAEPNRPYRSAAYPSPEYRILAAYKIWGAFRYFFGYKDLMDEDWDDVFSESLPKFLAAKDALAYNLTIAGMLTHVADSYSQPRSETLDAYFGKAPVGLRLRLIEKKPVITEILDENAKKAGVQVGDIVTKVDGEDIVARFQREVAYIPASTSQGLGYAAMQRILNGPDGSAATLTIKDRNDQLKQIQLKRSTRYLTALQKQRNGDVLRVFPGGIGYADLERLQPEDVDSMFEKFRDAKAIIFDGRGEMSRKIASAIAPRLTEESDVPAAIITGPLALTPDLVQHGSATSTASYFFVQTLPQSNQWKYKGKTAMLVDERTIGPAEHAALFLEVANKTELIGTPSAGADGELSNFTVPGGITISFTGNDIRHANGGKLQRLGLQPGISAAPTISGVRSGRDEVLNKAVEYFSDPEGRRMAALW
jgi:C-terminal processing protease CtpA/Prc